MFFRICPVFLCLELWSFLWCLLQLDIEMRGGKCWVAIESKTFEVSIEEVRGKLKGTIVERSRGLSSWIWFGDLSLRNLLEGFEECCREEKEGRLVKVWEEERRKFRLDRRVTWMQVYFVDSLDSNALCICMELS